MDSDPRLLASEALPGLEGPGGGVPALLRGGAGGVRFRFLGRSGGGAEWRPCAGLLKRSPFRNRLKHGFFRQNKGKPPLTSCNVQVYNVRIPGVLDVFFVEGIHPTVLVAGWSPSDIEPTRISLCKQPQVFYLQRKPCRFCWSPGSKSCDWQQYLGF